MQPRKAKDCWRWVRVESWMVDAMGPRKREVMYRVGREGRVDCWR